MNLWLIFITGLTIGGLGCVAVQGGLLASVTIGRNPKIATISFLIAKLISYTILGLLLGIVGDAVSISDQVQIILQIVSGIYMLIMAAQLIDLHPFFRYFVIQPPKFVVKLLRDESKSHDFFAPALLGFLTIFVPCGTTLAMEGLALSSANPLYAAAIMAVFTLGTSPIFFGIGLISRKINPKISAAFISLLAIYSIYGSLISLGLVKAISVPNNTSVQTSQNITIKVTSSGYSPNYVKVKVGEPVTINLVGVSNYSCASAFRIPQYKIAKNLNPNETTTISFTPNQKGKIQFNCSMGMYTGIIEAI